MAGDRDAAAIEARARALRAQLETDRTRQAKQRGNDEYASDKERAALRAQADVASKSAEQMQETYDRSQQRAAKLNQDAFKADEANQPDEAARLRAEAAKIRAEVKDLPEAIQARHDEAARTIGKLIEGGQRFNETEEARYDVRKRLQAAEAEIKDLEAKADYLRQAEQHDANAKSLEAEIARLRAKGDDTEADLKTAQLVDERMAADLKRTSADEVEVDEAKLRVLGTAAPAATPTALSALDGDADPLGVTAMRTAGLVDGPQPFAGITDGGVRAVAGPGSATGSPPGDTGPGQAYGQTMTTASDAAALEARATALRAEYLKDAREIQRAHLSGLDQHRQAQLAAEAKVKYAVEKADEREAGLKSWRTEIAEAPDKIAALEQEKRFDEAQELRERIADMTVRLESGQGSVDALRAEAKAATEQAAQEAAAITAMEAAGPASNERLILAEREIDAMEDKAAYLREAGVHDANVASLEKQVADLRAAGKGADADKLTVELVDERIAAGAKRGSADEITIDESKFEVLELGPELQPEAFVPRSQRAGDELIDPFADSTPALDPRLSGAQVSNMSGDLSGDPLKLTSNDLGNDGDDEGVDLDGDGIPDDDVTGGLGQGLDAQPINPQF